MWNGMTRARRSSIVSSIASRTGGLDYLELPSLLDDSYLFNKLEKLALVVGEGSKESVTLEKHLQSMKASRSGMKRNIANMKIIWGS